VTLCRKMKRRLFPEGYHVNALSLSLSLCYTIRYEYNVTERGDDSTTYIVINLMSRIYRRPEADKKLVSSKQLIHLSEQVSSAAISFILRHLGQQGILCRTSKSRAVYYTASNNVMPLKNEHRVPDKSDKCHCRRCFIARSAVL